MRCHRAHQYRGRVAYCTRPRRFPGCSHPKKQRVSGTVSARLHSEDCDSNRSSFEASAAATAVTMARCKKVERITGHASIAAGGRILTRAAANSMARGKPSSRKQISATARELSSFGVNAGSTAVARSMNKATAGFRSNSSNGGKLFRIRRWQRWHGIIMFS